MTFEMDSLKTEGEHHDKPTKRVRFSFADQNTVEIQVDGSPWVEVDVNALLGLLAAGQCQNAHVYAEHDRIWNAHSKTCKECSR